MYQKHLNFTSQLQYHCVSSTHHNMFLLWEIEPQEPNSQSGKKKIVWNEAIFHRALNKILICLGNAISRQETESLVFFCCCCFIVQYRPRDCSITCTRMFLACKSATLHANYTRNTLTFVYSLCFFCFCKGSRFQ